MAYRYLSAFLTFPLSCNVSVVAVCDCVPLFFLLPCRASYAKLYIVFDPDFTDTVDDEVLDAISSQFLFQLGFLLILPIPLLLAVEQVLPCRRGWRLRAP